MYGSFPWLFSRFMSYRSYSAEAPFPTPTFNTSDLIPKEAFPFTSPSHLKLGAICMATCMITSSPLPQSMTLHDVWSFLGPLDTLSIQICQVVVLFSTSDPSESSPYAGILLLGLRSCHNTYHRSWERISSSTRLRMIMKMSAYQSPSKGLFFKFRTSVQVEFSFEWMFLLYH